MTDIPEGPLLADGRATPLGIEVCERYKELKDAIDRLEKEREELRNVILEAASLYPDSKSFPAGDMVIRISEQTRETVPVAKIKKEDPTVYEGLVAAGFVTRSVAKVLSVR